MTLAELLRDVRARLARLLEAVADGEYALAEQIGEDLEHDLLRWAEALEREAA